MTASGNGHSGGGFLFGGSQAWDRETLGYGVKLLSRGLTVTQKRSENRRDIRVFYGVKLPGVSQNAFRIFHIELFLTKASYNL